MFNQNFKVEKAKCIDAGMGLVLALLLIANVFMYIPLLNYISIFILIVTMSIPKLLRPFAFIYFYVSNVLGNIVSKILLIFIFFFLVTPVGLVVSIFRKDPLKLHQFKKQNKSVFDYRNHVFSKDDLEKPY